MAEKPRMQARCSAITRAGTKCKGAAIEGSDWCYSHHPERAEERRANAKAGGEAGGRSRPRRSPDELEEIKRQIRTVSGAVLKGGLDKNAQTVDKATAAVLGQLYNVQLRAIEVQRKLDDQKRLEEEVQELREMAEAVKRSRGW